MDIKTDLDTINEYITIGLGFIGARLGEAEDFTVLAGSLNPTGSNAGRKNQREQAMTNSPFYQTDGEHWGIRARDVGYKCMQSAEDPDSHTHHQVWIR